MATTTKQTSILYIWWQRQSYGYYLHIQKEVTLFNSSQLQYKDYLDLPKNYYYVYKKGETKLFILQRYSTYPLLGRQFYLQHDTYNQVR